MSYRVTTFYSQMSKKGTSPEFIQASPRSNEFVTQNSTFAKKRFNIKIIRMSLAHAVLNDTQATRSRIYFLLYLWYSPSFRPFVGRSRLLCPTSNIAMSSKLTFQNDLFSGFQYLTKGSVCFVESPMKRQNESLKSPQFASQRAFDNRYIKPCTFPSGISQL